MALRQVSRLRLNIQLFTAGSRSMGTGEAGSGAGKGGGSGGSIRDAGGSLGKKQAAQEEQYFRNLQEKQLKEMKSGLEKEVKFHEEQIKAHQEALKRHKERLDKIDD